MGDKLVTIAEFALFEEAAVPQSMLKASGIKSFVAGQRIIRYTGESGEIRLQVKATDAAKATKIIAAYRKRNIGHKVKNKFNFIPELRHRKPLFYVCLGLSLIVLPFLIGLLPYTENISGIDDGGILGTWVDGFPILLLVVICIWVIFRAIVFIRSYLSS